MDNKHKERDRLYLRVFKSGIDHVLVIWSVIHFYVVGKICLN